MFFSRGSLTLKVLALNFNLFDISIIIFMVLAFHSQIIGIELGPPMSNFSGQILVKCKLLYPGVYLGHRQILWWSFIAKSVNTAGNYMTKVSNRNTRTRFEICSKLTVKTPERRQWLLTIFLKKIHGRYLTWS